MVRRAAIAVIMATGLLAAAAAGLFVFRSDVAEAVLRSRLTALGVPAPEFNVADIDFQRIRLTEISLGSRGELRAAALTVTYDLDGLLAGRLGSVTAEGLTVEVDLTGDGPPLGSLQPLLAGAEAGVGWAWLPPIRVSGGWLELASPAGRAAVEYDGEMGLDEEGGLAAAFGFHLYSRPGWLDGTLGVSARDPRTWTGKLVINGGALDLPDAEVGGLTGEVDFTLSDGRPNPLRAKLIFSDVVLQETPFEAVRVSLEATPTRITVEGEVRSAERQLAVTLGSTVEDYMTEPRLELDLEAEVTAAAAIWDLLALPPPAAGRGQVSLRIRGRLPPAAEFPGRADEALGWLLGSDLRGRLRLELAEVGYRGLVDGLAARLEVDAALESGTLSIGLPVDAHMHVARVAPEVLAWPGVPAELRRLLERDLSLVLSASAETPFRARIQQVATGTEVQLDGSARLTTAAGAAIMATAKARFTFDEEIALQKVDVPQFTLTLRDLALAGQRISKARLSGAVSGRPGDFAGTGDLELALPEAALDALTAGSLKARLPAAFRLIDGGFEAWLRGSGTAVVESLAYGHLLRLAKPLRLKVAGGRLVLGPADGGDFELSYALTLEPGDLEVKMARDAGTAVTVSVEPGTIRLDEKAAPDGRYGGRLTIEGARLAVPEYGIALEDLSATVALGAADHDPLARFTVGALRHSGKPSFFAPLRLTGHVTREGGVLALAAEGYASDGTRRATLSARHRLGDGRGEAQLRLDDLAFVPGILQPADLFPILRDLRSVTGNAAATASLAWTQEGMDSAGMLELRDVSFTADEGTVEGLTILAVFDGLLPPSTPPGQEATARRIDSAVPVDDLNLRFRVQPEDPPRMLIEQASLRFAGGRFNVVDAVLDPGSPRQDLTLEVEGLDLAKLFELVEVEGLSGSGLIDGVIPVTLAADTIMIRNARLRAAGPGILRFRSEAAAALQAGGEPVDLMLRALQNFHYDTLSLTAESLTAEKTAADGLQITLRMLGNNPDVLEGHPFDFNIDLTVNLGSVLEAIRRGARISGDLIRRMPNK